MYNEKDYVLYTLKNEDFRGYLSLYRLFMEEGDITEWRFVQKYLHSWDHWEILCSTPWFKPYITKWRKELELKLRSEALAKIKETAQNKSHKQNLEANKYLLSGSWMPKEDAKRRGRPSKEEIKEEAVRMAQDEQKLAEDYQRVLQ